MVSQSCTLHFIAALQVWHVLTNYVLYRLKFRLMESLKGSTLKDSISQTYTAGK